MSLWKIELLATLKVRTELPPMTTLITSPLICVSVIYSGDTLICLISTLLWKRLIRLLRTSRSTYISANIGRCIAPYTSESQLRLADSLRQWGSKGSTTFRSMRRRKIGCRILLRLLLYSSSDTLLWLWGDETPRGNFPLPFSFLLRLARRSTASIPPQNEQLIGRSRSTRARFTRLRCELSLKYIFRGQLQLISRL